MLENLFFAGLVAWFAGATLPLISISSDSKTFRRISLGIYAIASLLLADVSLFAAYKNITIAITIYKILPQIQFSFMLDRLSALFVLMISVVSLCASIYSVGYVEHGHHKVRKNLLVSLMGFFILSMILVVSSANTFAFIFFWETMSLSSFFLVMYEYEKKETRKAGIFYFAMTQLSTVFLITAFVVLYAINGSFDIRHTAFADPSLLTAVFLLLFVGFSIKAGVIPFHKWLPYAHPASPSNISALMSGLMIKVAIYGMMRFLLFALAPELWWGILVLSAGIISAILGVIYAMKENDLKRLLAYSSIENIGVVLVGLGLYLIFSQSGLPSLAILGLAGALFHAFNHAIFKSLLFLTSGSVVYSTGTRNIEEMGGLVHRMPFTAISFFIGALSISALPPLSGFVGEFLIFQSFLDSHALADPMLRLLMVTCLSSFALTSALAAACFVKAFGAVFLAVPRTENAQKAHEVPKSMIAGPIILAALCVVLGIFSRQIFKSLGFSIDSPDLFFIGVFLIASYALTFAVLRAASSGKVRISETWGCGIISQNGRMEYTASGFAQPLVRMLKAIYRTEERSERKFFDSQSSIFKEGKAEMRLMQFFEEYIYMPIARAVNTASKAVAHLQTGSLDDYIAYTFVAVVVLLLVVGWII
ncbi:MAG: proton-conducting transporter membrane subunit [Candidatus Thermoplasmatota archaeon]|nr:proton-conducting transporter membrane subunit [Candidatus Thermoplasmatota archaeon]